MFTTAPEDRFARLGRTVASLPFTATALREIVGWLTGLRDDYEAGMLEKLTNRIEAELVTDFLGQARSLLTEQHKSVADRVPAAVLAGAVLENGLRTLCHRQVPPVPVLKPGGGPKMLNALIDDLKAAGLYNELQAADLRVWAHIRSAAAHGEFDKFDLAKWRECLRGCNRSSLATSESRRLCDTPGWA